MPFRRRRQREGGTLVIEERVRTDNRTDGVRFLQQNKYLDKEAKLDPRAENGAWSRSDFITHKPKDE